MLTSCTSSEEESIPYFRKFVQNIRNNNIGPQLTSMGVDRFASCENIVPQVSGLVNSSPPPRLVPKSPWRNSSTATAEEFYYSSYENEGLENKLKRAPFLGLAKSAYYDLKCIFTKWIFIKWILDSFFSRILDSNAQYSKFDFERFLPYSRITFVLFMVLLINRNTCPLEWERCLMRY